MDLSDPFVPIQESGSKSDTDHTVTTHTRSEAAAFYETSRQRLLDVNKWHHFAGQASATFQLTDALGRDVYRLVGKGDHFKIKLPVPTEKPGDDYDWVHVEDVFEKNEPGRNWEAQFIRVRPAADPLQSDKDVEHFFDKKATSTFIVQRLGHEITASVHGRNEQVNKENDNVLDQARNTLVAIGAMLGLSTPQWKSLVKGLLEKG